MNSQALEQIIQNILTFKTLICVIFISIFVLNISRSIRGIKNGEPIGEHIIDIVIAVGIFIGFIVFGVR